MEDKFYLQDKRSYVGNDILFWRDGGGYTTDVSKAEIFTKEQALNQNKCRHTDIPWPKEYIDANTRPAVDMQYVNNKDALISIGIELPKEPKPSKRPQNRCYCGKFIRSWESACSGCE